MPISGFQFIFAKREILGNEFSAFDEIVETAPCRVVSTLIYSIIKAEKCANMCEGDKNCFKTYEFGIFLKLESKKIYEARKCNFLSPTLFSINAFLLKIIIFLLHFGKPKNVSLIWYYCSISGMTKFHYHLPYTYLYFLHIQTFGMCIYLLVVIFQVIENKWPDSSTFDKTITSGSIWQQWKVIFQRGKKREHEQNEKWRGFPSLIFQAVHYRFGNPNPRQTPPLSPPPPPKIIIDQK